MGPITTAITQGLKRPPVFCWGCPDATGTMRMPRAAGLAGVCFLALTSCAGPPAYEPGPPPPITEPAAPVSQPDPLVRSIQIALVHLGYLRGTADGYCGPKTHAAIVDFEGARGLPTDGRCSKFVHDQLYKKSEAPPAAPARAPVMEGPAYTNASPTGGDLPAVTSTEPRQVPMPVAPSK